MLGFWLSGSQKRRRGRDNERFGKDKRNAAPLPSGRSGGTLEPRSLFSKMESEVGDVLVYNFP